MKIVLAFLIAGAAASGIAAYTAVAKPHAGQVAGTGAGTGAVR